MVAFAARYGHQPLLTELRPLTLARINAFNDGLYHWIEKENRSGSTVTNYAAEGGG